MYISDSFKRLFKWTKPEMLEELFQDYKYDMNIIYEGADYLDTNVYDSKKGVEQLYNTEDKVRKFNHDDKGNLSDVMLMAWDVTDYIFKNRIDEGPYKNYSLKKLVVQEYLSLGGLIFYKGRCYSDFDEFIQKNKNDKYN